MIVMNLLLSLLVLCAVYGLIWFIVTAADPADRSVPRRRHDDDRLAA